MTYEQLRYVENKANSAFLINNLMRLTVAYEQILENKVIDIINNDWKKYNKKFGEEASFDSFVAKEHDKFAAKYNSYVTSHIDSIIYQAKDDGSITENKKKDMAEHKENFIKSGENLVQKYQEKFIETTPVDQLLEKIMMDPFDNNASQEIQFVTSKFNCYIRELDKADKALKLFPNLDHLSEIASMKMGEVLEVKNSYDDYLKLHNQCASFNSKILYEGMTPLDSISMPIIADKEKEVEYAHDKSLNLFNEVLGQDTPVDAN